VADLDHRSWRLLGAVIREQEQHDDGRRNTRGHGLEQEPAQL
jgi:hypothetical protein